MPDTRMQSWHHEDVQNNLLVIAAYADIGIGPAIVFDGGGFTDAECLRSFARDLREAAEWLDKETEARA